MKNLNARVGLLMLLFISISSCTTKNENTQPDYVKLEAEVRDIVPYSLELFRKKDLEGLVNRFAADGTLKNVNSPILTGIDAIRESYKGALQLQDFKLDLKCKKVDIAKAGDMAYMLLDFSFSFQTQGGPVGDQGTVLMVLKRVDDKWKIAAENLSSAPK